MIRLKGRLATVGAALCLASSASRGLPTLEKLPVKGSVASDRLPPDPICSLMGACTELVTALITVAPNAAEMHQSLAKPNENDYPVYSEAFLKKVHQDHLVPNDQEPSLPLMYLALWYGVKDNPLGQLTLSQFYGIRFNQRWGWVNGQLAQITEFEFPSEKQLANGRDMRWSLKVPAGLKALEPEIK